MFRRAITQSSFSPSTLPPTFLLPLRAHLSTATTTTTSTLDPSPPSTSYVHTPPSPLPNYPLPTSHAQSRQTPLSPHRPSRRSPLPLPTNANLDLLPLLAAQKPHYITAHIHARPYLLTAGDTLRLPFHLPNAPPGTILRFNRASMIGSRDYTFRGAPWVDEKFFVLRAVVTGVEGEPMRVVEKTKRRQRRVKRVRSKMRFTILRVQELRVVLERQEEGSVGMGVVMGMMGMGMGMGMGEEEGLEIEGEDEGSVGMGLWLDAEGEEVLDAGEVMEKAKELGN